jgi:hypothetical protein
VMHRDAQEQRGRSGGCAMASPSWYANHIESGRVDGAHTYTDPTVIWRLHREGEAARSAVVPHTLQNTLVCVRAVGSSCVMCQL